MADVYGVRITPDDGGKSIILDGSMRYASYLGSASIAVNGGVSGGFKPQPTNSQALIVPRRLATVFQGSAASGPPMSFVNNIGFNGSNLTFNIKTINGNTSSASEAAFVDVFSVAYASNPQTQYGVRITNGANFMEIGDATYSGYVTYRGVIDINGQWNVPQSVIDLGNYVIFARWSNTDIPLFMDRGTNSIRTYTSFGSGDGSVQGGFVGGVQIVIVSSGFIPALPASGYGMVIRNAAGQITYSSKYPPVMWPSAYYDFGGYENYDDSTGEVQAWINPTGSVSQPMIPLCSIGCQRGDFSRTSGNYTFRKCLLSGMKMNGNAVTTARAQSTFRDIALYQYPKAVQVACQLPCIDASYYF
ncbi:hypothetical protein H2241_17910 [Pantoea ananatis]|uniref:DUF6453 family protein n=1 Tax=Pantoea ananas TaxID=553 RepID=UPI00158EB57D|nr:DUF6453 family protein [Pantoea ananatis]MBA4822825.1 hypothetical protein [Pantoea ananatis]QKV87600.1 hypothetical protein FOB88_10895 [Pantoea ananatis]